MDRNSELKLLVSKKSIGTLAVLMLLALSAFASVIIPVHAAPRPKENVLIEGSGSVELTWKSGKTETYSSTASVSLGRLDTVAFTPTNGWHVSDLEIDEDPIDLSGLDTTDEFSLFNVKAKSIAVEFVENGGVDDVDPEDLDAYPVPGVGVIFVDVVEGGIVSAYTVGFAPPDFIGDTWDIQTTASFTQPITIMLSLTYAQLGAMDPYAVTMWRTEEELARADVTRDGEVNGDDVSDVANANPSEVGDPMYEARLDQDSNGIIDDTDVNTVNDYIGMEVWEEIPIVDRVEDEDLGIWYFYAVTDRLSHWGFR